MADEPQNAHLERAEIRKTTKKVKESARHIETSAHNIEDTSDRSTELAADRTIFAAERTYAAWVRTGLAALASGIGARTLLGKVMPDPMVMFASTVLVIFSALCFCAAVWRELLPRLDDPIPRVRRLPRAMLFLVNGSLALVALVALAGIWLGWIRHGM